MLKTILKNLPNWIKTYGINGDVTISSRIRIARNIEGFKFPFKCSVAEKNKIVEKLKYKIENSSFYKKYNLFGLNIIDLKDVERLALVEMHIVSPLFIENPYGKYLYLSEDGSISIMINEEDHIRLQIIKEGFSLDEIIINAFEIIDEIEDKIELSYSNTLGFITSCPTNLGTGLRASLLMHLPILTLIGKMNEIIENSTKFSITIRGTFGEGSEIISSLFQISNTTTLGKSEENIIDSVKKIGIEILKIERNERDKYFINKKNFLLDEIRKAKSKLKYSYKISYKEASEILSILRLGSILKVIDIPIELLNELLMKIRSNIMKVEFDTPLESFIDNLRAEYLKNILMGYI
ncbi:MAG: ATP--guanido phosphotransferase [Caldisericia bacterium]|nr:ATP--guanido phosphotransferase [Caldisericia bacterium]